MLRSTKKILGLVVLVILAALASSPGPALAATGRSDELAQAARLGVPAGSVSRLERHVPGMRLTPAEVILLAKRDPRARAQLVGLNNPKPHVYANPANHKWEVIFGQGKIAEFFVDVDDRSAAVISVQGVNQAVVNQLGVVGAVLVKPYVWLIFCLLFVLPFVDRRRPRRLLHLDLLALLAFTVSHAFAKRGNASVSVPLVYPVLLYLLARMAAAGFRPRHRFGRLVPQVSVTWLVVGVVVLTGVKIGLNLVDSTQLDVGVASVVGADRILHGNDIYDGSINQVVPGGDTYGPVTYLAYVPFTKLFPSSWKQSHLWAAHASAIAFDCLTLLGLFLLGGRLRGGREGRRLGVVLAYAWASFPYSAFVLSSNTNDSLVAALLVFTLVAIASPPARGALLALASFAKFFPLALVPLMATATGARQARTWFMFGLAFVLVGLACTLPFIPPNGLHGIYRLTIGYQLTRLSPLSIWSQHPVLAPLQRVLEVATVCFAIGLAIARRPRGAGQVAALSAAVVLAIQLCLNYWFYFYIVWFAPLVFVALFSEYGSLFRMRGKNFGSTLAHAEPPVIGDVMSRPPVLAPAGVDG